MAGKNLVQLIRFPILNTLGDKVYFTMSQKAITDQLATKVPTTRRINGKPLTGDVTLTAADVGALTAQGNAATATKLQTPRTINGTNFDGSSNITTLNWGTSRTLTFGNTGKNVNGSANVSWTLAEMGAAPATLTLTAGNGMVGGGNLTANRTITLGTPSAIHAGTNSTVTAESHTHSIESTSARTYASGNALLQAVAMKQHIDSGDHDARYLNASNLNAGTVPAARLSGTYNISISGNSASATKLATARTINGANFDGTGNITTANWGTARNITIGNTTKSVNGSANVSWNLNEIGLGSIENKKWVELKRASISVALANGTNVYTGAVNTGLKTEGRTFDQSRYRVVLWTDGEVRTGNPGAMWWSCRGEVVPRQHWSAGNQLWIHVWCSGAHIQRGNVTNYIIYEWK